MSVHVYLHKYIYIHIDLHAFKHTHKEISVRFLENQKDKQAAKHEEPKASTQNNCFSESLPTFFHNKVNTTKGRRTSPKQQ